MWKLRFWLILAAVLIALDVLPLGATDAARLEPATLLIFDRAADGTVRVVSDSGSEGRGRSVDAALQDLRDHASGMLYLQTAEHILLTERAQSLLPACTRSRDLRPAASVLRIAGEIPDAKQAAAYLRHRAAKPTLAGLRAKKTELPTLYCREGRLLLV